MIVVLLMILFQHNKLSKKLKRYFQYLSEFFYFSKHKNFKYEKNEVIRLYNFSDAKLIDIGNEKVAFMRRDIGVFADYGLTEVQFLFQKLKLSNSLISLQILKPLMNKYRLQSKRCESRRVACCHSQCNDEGCSKVWNFQRQICELWNFYQVNKDADLCYCKTCVVRVGTTNLNDLAEGLQQSHLDTITQLNNEFDALLIEQN